MRSMAHSSAPSVASGGSDSTPWCCPGGVSWLAVLLVDGWLALERRVTRAAFRPVSGKPASWQRARNSYTVRVLRSTCGVGTRAPRGWERRPLGIARKKKAKRSSTKKLRSSTKESCKKRSSTKESCAHHKRFQRKLMLQSLECTYYRSQRPTVALAACQRGKCSVCSLTIVCSLTALAACQRGKCSVCSLTIVCSLKLSFHRAFSLLKRKTMFFRRFSSFECQFSTHLLCNISSKYPT